MLFLIERCQCIAGCYAEDCIATNQGDHADSWKQWACEQQNWITEQWKKMTWSHESRFLLNQADGSVRVMHYGKKTSWQRQCDALGHVLLRNLVPPT